MPGREEGDWGENGGNTKGHQEIIGGNRHVHYLHCGDGYMHQIVDFKCAFLHVNYTSVKVWKLYGIVNTITILFTIMLLLLRISKCLRSSPKKSQLFLDKVQENGRLAR